MNGNLLGFFFIFCVLNLYAQGNRSANKEVLFSTKQNFLIEQFTTKDGLSNNAVSDILQDQNGYLWIGTFDGLNRFNGYDFTVFKYRPGDHSSLSNNKTYDLHEDSAGNLWIATDGGLNLYDPITEQFKVFQHDVPNKNSTFHNKIGDICEDTEGVLWLGTNLGLSKFDKEKKTFQLFQHKEQHTRYWETEPSYDVSEIIEVGNEKLIIGYWGMGLMLFDKTKESFQQIPVNHKLDQFALNLTTDALEKEKNGKIWVTAGGELFHYDEEKGLLGIKEEEISPNKELSLFFPSPSGQYMLGGNLVGEGFHLLDKGYQSKDHFLPVLNPTDPNQNVIEAVLEDKAGDIWLGTRGAGLFHLNATGSYFTNFPYPTDSEKEANKPNFNALVELDENLIWMTTRWHGMHVFNRKNNAFEKAPDPLAFPKGLLTKQLTALHKDKRGNIWIGTWGTGIALYKPASRTIQYFRSFYNDDTSPSDKFIGQFLETKEGEIWVATTNGLCALFTEHDIQEGKFKRYKHNQKDSTSLNHYHIHCLYQRQNEQIWIGTADGLHRYNRAKDAFARYGHNINNSNSISSSNVSCLFEDSNQQLWIGTGGGLNKFDDEFNSFSLIKGEGVLEGYISSIREDEKGLLWLGTKKGLVRYDPKTGQVETFSAKDGLLNNNFTDKNFMIAEKTGEIYVGGKNGISVFHPDSIQDNSFIPPIHISALKIYNAEKDQTTNAKVNEISEEGLQLSYQENIITFELTALNFRSANENQYAYKLEGFNNNWINLGTKREITFTNLDPGKYTLSVKGANNDGVWNEEMTTLEMTILPPWWKTGSAYFLYALAGLFTLYLIYRGLLRRQKLQQQLQSEKSEAARLKELDSFKTRLTTNLTHEFRTPLTVILGMVGQIKSNPQKYLDEGTHLIETNGKNLLRLINQLLDLSRLENKSFQLQLQQGDIIPFLRYLTESFHSFANSKNVSLRFFATQQPLFMDHDPEQIKQVMTNLISNALKFTPDDGEVVVNLSVNEETLTIEVKDNGIGIASKDLPHVFDRFYQVDGSTTREGEGTGIGLAHTQELVKLMDGNIMVESELEKGSTFIIHLPIRKEALLKKTIGETDLAIDIDIPNNGITKRGSITSENLKGSPLPELLIIEDNPDVVVYLKSCLEKQYQLDVAYNGKIGIEKALEKIPDLIISDVMMPEKDGYEVCDMLKNDERTSHIPIILLTAKADATSKLLGLKRGADAYLSKPFDKEELLIRLKKLVERQKKVLAYFLNKNQTKTATIASEQEIQEAITVEDIFIQKVKDLIEANYRDEDFSLPQLCQKIGMSRSQLFRKMKALMGTSPSDFIRSYRLAKAKKLLESADFNVAEAAYEVGFKDPSYFSKIFQDEFGLAPSATRDHPRLKD